MLSELNTPRRMVNGHEMWIDEFGILRTVMKEGMHVTLQDAEAHIAAGLELTGGNKHPILVNFQNIKSMDRSARAFYAGSNTTRLEKAVAIVIGSPIGQIIGNFFIGLNRSTVPTRLFTSEETAMEWLKEFCE